MATTPEEVTTMMTTCSLTPLQGDADNEQFAQTKEELVEIFGQIPTSYGGASMG
jgi:hypothetical protein